MATVKIEDLKPNSHISKEEKKKKEVQKVISGKAVKKEKTTGQKFAEIFISEDVDNVKDYVFFDVVVPAIKEAIVNAITGGIEMIFFGDSHSRNTRREGGKSYVSYSSYYKSDNSNNNRNRAVDRRSRGNYSPVEVDSRTEGEEILSNLVDFIVDYGQATVADLYELAGLSSNFTDNKWGWVDLSSASVKRVRNGYLIDLPNPEELD